MDLYDSLARWNLWGSWKLPASFVREQVEEICRYIKAEEIIALIGPRRSGKSTILYQLMQYLLDEGVAANAILHVNFEEPGLSPYLKLALLDQLYNTYRSKVYPKGKVFIFLDEIQNVLEWERWVRARNDTEDIKIFLTGSSSALLSGEFATALRGRNFCFNIYPLNFKEVLQFKKIEIPSKPFPNAALPEVEFALNEFLTWGGFPRVVLAQNSEEKTRILQRYFDEILFKDIVQRHKIRNEMALRNIAIHLLTNTSTLITLRRIADIFQVSQDLALSYIQYLKEAFMVSTLDFYSLKTSERIRNPMKVHAVDLGLRKIASLSSSADETKLLETQMHNALKCHQNDEVFYWKRKGEIDLLTQKGGFVTGLYQVAYAGLNQEKVEQREFCGLQKAMIQFPKASGYLITRIIDDATCYEKYPDIVVKPLWQFLLECIDNV